MRKKFRQNFARKMIRADCRLDDPLFGALSQTRRDGLNAKIYLELGKERRSRPVGNKLYYLLTNAYGVVITGIAIVWWTIPAARSFANM